MSDTTLYRIDDSIEPMKVFGGSQIYYAIIPVELVKVGGTYTHPWHCANCHGDHGGEGCTNPDSGRWCQWYEIDDIAGVDISDE